ncbi:MAG: hypothetical protein MZU91_14720 [Desulfosudis oleivorans]|nr:hypothetical protein [Desulfosudis oleivorans]
MDDLSAQAAADAAGVGLAHGSGRSGVDRGVFPSAQPSHESLHPKTGHAARRCGGALQPGRHGARLPAEDRGVACFSSCRGCRSRCNACWRTTCCRRMADLPGGRREVRRVKTLSCFGLTESLTGERLDGLGRQFPGIRLGLRARFPGNPGQALRQRPG